MQRCFKECLPLPSLSASLWPPAQQVPEGFPLHVLLCDAVIDESLIPDGVPSVSQGFCPELVGLEPRETDRQTDGEPAL